MVFSIVKMENKNSQIVFFRLDYVDPHLIQQCLGPPQAPPQIAAPTIEALAHTDPLKSPLVTMVRPKFAPKSTPSRGTTAKPQYLPNPWTRPTYGAKRLPDAICRFYRASTCEGGLGSRNSVRLSVRLSVCHTRGL